MRTMDELADYIQSLRNNVARHYDLPPEAAQRAEELYARMESWGTKCGGYRPYWTTTLGERYEQEWVDMVTLDFRPYTKDKKQNQHNIK